VNSGLTPTKSWTSFCEEHHTAGCFAVDPRQTNLERWTRMKLLAREEFSNEETAGK
jgi:hypothetical protein